MRVRTMLKSKRVRYHDMYRKESNGIWWWQYRVFVVREYYLFGYTVWSKTLASRDTPSYVLIKRAFGV